MAEEPRYQQGLVSIVTPVYKAERFIGDTIRSVQAQTYRNWELLLIDDCSPDRSGEIILGMAASDDRLKYHRLEHNGGAAVARNAAISHAKGEYLAFLDSDDLWVPDKLERQLDFLHKHNAAFVFARIQMVDNEGHIVKSRIPIPARTDYRHLLRNTVIATSTVLLHRPTLKPFTMPLRRGGQDYATWLLLLRRTDYAYGQDERLVSYRVGNESLSSGKLKSIRQVYEIQTQDEHINRWSACINTLCFCLYAFRKHYL